MDVVGVIYLVKFAIHQSVQRWGRKTNVDKSMNKLESMNIAGTQESKPELASVFHHFQPLIEKPVLFTMELHMHLTKDSGKLKERVSAGAGEIADLMLLHTNKVCQKTNNYVHELLQCLVPCTNFQRIKIWLLLHFHISQKLISLVKYVYRKRFRET